MTGLIGKDRPDKDADITILTKYIVAPEKAKDFIEAIKKVRGCDIVYFSDPSHRLSQPSAQQYVGRIGSISNPNWWWRQVMVLDTW